MARLWKSRRRSGLPKERIRGRCWPRESRDGGQKLHARHGPRVRHSRAQEHNTARHSPARTAASTARQDGHGAAAQNKGHSQHQQTQPQHGTAEKRHGTTAGTNSDLKIQNFTTDSEFYKKTVPNDET